MKATLLAGIFVYVALFVFTTFVPSAEAQAEAARFFSAEEIERGLQFSYQRRLLFWLQTGVNLGLLAALVFTGWARRLADTGMRWSGQRWWLTILFVGAVVFLAQACLALPLGLIRLENQRAWGLTQRSIPDWLVEHFISLGVAAIIGGALLMGLYLLIRCFPRTWWALATAGALLFAVAFAFVLPVLIAPLYNTFTPLRDTEWASLEPTVRYLIDKAGITIQDVYVVDASRQSGHTNAYFTGFGSTRRIVLFDTLLSKHPRAEIESILAHEIGHWQYDHIAKGIILAGLGALVGFFLLARILQWAIGRPPFSLTRPFDPGGIPLVLLLALVSTWLAMPVQNVVSRYFERQADQTALDLGGRPDAFVAAEKRLAHDNIMNVAPTPLNVWLFASHPPAVERIRMATEWRQRREE